MPVAVIQEKINGETCQVPVVVWRSCRDLCGAEHTSSGPDQSAASGRSAAEAHDSADVAQHSAERGCGWALCGAVGVAAEAVHVHNRPFWCVRCFEGVRDPARGAEQYGVPAGRVHAQWCAWWAGRQLCRPGQYPHAERHSAAKPAEEELQERVRRHVQDLQGRGCALLVSDRLEAQHCPWRADDSVTGSHV